MNIYKGWETFQGKIIPVKRQLTSLSFGIVSCFLVYLMYIYLSIYLSIYKYIYIYIYKCKCIYNIYTYRYVYILYINLHLYIYIYILQAPTLSIQYLNTNMHKATSYLSIKITKIIFFLRFIIKFVIFMDSAL